MLPNRRRTGFTLVELLVVIGIIAVLISILLPALARTREQANRVKCMANHKQLMTAFIMYANDWKGRVPFKNGGGYESDGEYNGPGWLYWSQNGKYSGDGRSDPRDVEFGSFYTYLKGPGVYRCPMDLPPYDPPGGTHNLTSYLMNINMNFRRPTVLYKITQFKPDDIVFWEVNEQQAGGYWNDGTNSPGEGITARHGKGVRGPNALAIVSCIDGRAEWITVGDYDKELTKDRPNRLHCGPHNDPDWVNPW